MAVKRIFAVRINLDDLGAELDTLHTAAERSDWLAGFRSGSRGAPPPAKASPALQMGSEFGLRAHTEAVGFRDQRSIAGQVSAQRRANDRSTSVEHPFNENTNGCSTDVEREPQRMFNGDHNGDPNHPISSIQQPISKQPPAASHTEPEDPRLVAAAAAGAYLNFKGDDLRTDWLVAIEVDSVDLIGRVMAYGRKRTGKPVRMPCAYCDHRLAMLQAEAHEIGRQRTAAAQEAQRQQDHAANSAKAKESAAAIARGRALAAALLEVYDERAEHWCSQMNTVQAAALADIRATYLQGRPLGLVLRHVQTLPTVMITQAQARAKELNETTEGATA